jgi:NAD(P)-dependent dehydrogenase (short-subunit alcohol dehydrogenase family)
MLACDSKHGVIVNISSMAGLRARQKMAHYVSAKSGVVGLTKAMGLELGAKNIRVMGIAPANMSTRPHTPEQEERYKHEFPLGRAGKPDDIARVVLFCASDLAGFMTGSTLIVDGGTGAGIYP